MIRSPYNLRKRRSFMPAVVPTHISNINTNISQISPRFNPVVKLTPLKISTISRINFTPASIINRNNRGHAKIYRCDARKCSTCPRLIQDSTVKSNVNGRKYSINFPRDVS